MFKTREEWLNALADKMAPQFALYGEPLAESFRVSCAFPSTGRKAARIGECWSKDCSKDKHYEIFIHPKEDNPMRVADILAHELIHATVGLDQKHGGRFAKMARAIGLEGKLTATTAGDIFKGWVQPLLDELGPYPHGMLNTERGKSTKGPAKKTALLKVCCGECGYICRITNKWIEEVGTPICRCNNKPMEVA